LGLLCVKKLSPPTGFYPLASFSEPRHMRPVSMVLVLSNVFHPRKNRRTSMNPVLFNVSSFKHVYIYISMCIYINNSNNNNKKNIYIVNICIFLYLIISIRYKILETWRWQSQSSCPRAASTFCCPDRVQALTRNRARRGHPQRQRQPWDLCNKTD
jgi:hypothetical protein